MKGKSIPRKLPGEKRIRVNFVIDHGTNARFRKQAKLRGATLSDAFRRGLELLEKEHESAREVIKQAATDAALMSPYRQPGEPE